MKTKILIIILASNKIDLLKESYKSACNQKYFDNEKYSYNIILNINTLDDSFYQNVLSEFPKIKIIRTHSNGKPGKGHNSSLEIFRNDKNYDYLITFDGDGQNQASDANQMIKLAKKNNLSAVLGTRFKNKIYLKEIPFSKKIILNLAKIYEKLFFKITFTDAHNGLRVLKRDLVANYIRPIKNFDMSHATEISYKICKSKCKYREYSVKVKYKNKRSQHPINAINIAIRNIIKPL